MFNWFTNLFKKNNMTETNNELSESKETQKASSETELTSVYIPTEEENDGTPVAETPIATTISDNITVTDAPVVNEEITAETTNNDVPVIDVTDTPMPDATETPVTPTEERSADALYVYPSKKIEITKKALFLNSGLEMEDITVWRAEPLVYAYSNSEIGEQYYTCENIHEADKLWQELLQYESGDTSFAETDTTEKVEGGLKDSFDALEMLKPYHLRNNN